MRPMSRGHDVQRRLQRRLAFHQALHDPVREPRNALRWLPELRRWQAARLERSFRRFLENPRSRRCIVGITRAMSASRRLKSWSP